MSRLVGAPQSWAVSSLEAAAAAAKLLSLGPPEFVRSPSRLLVPLGEITAVAADELPGYECAGIWDWREGGFRRDGRSEVSTPVRVEWHTRPDRPDVFVVRREDGTPWSTHARNWALLVAYRWSGRRAFEAFGEGALARVEGFGPYLPLPSARAIAIGAGVVSGPSDLVGRGRSYVYSCSSARERAALTSWLDGRENHGDDRRLKWLLTTLLDASSDRDSVAVPRDIVRRLGALDLGREAARLSGRRVSRRLLPQLRRAVEQAGV